MADLKVAAERRILELEAELAVRDNMGNEVLRILREVTGKRDFHSEREAAEWAARMIIDLQTQLFMSQQSAKEAMSREAAAVSREIGARAELAEARADSARKQFMCQQGCYMAHDKDGESCWLIWPYGKDGDGQPETQSGMYDSHDAAIDAAMKEAK